jgi:hypothetical protein
MQSMLLASQSGKRAPSGSLGKRYRTITVLLPAFAFELVTAGEMSRRRVQFVQKISSGYRGPVIVAEGDSWFCYPRDSVWVPDDAPVDVVAQLSNEFAVSGVAKPGDTAQNMADFFHPFVTQDLQTWNAHILLLSAGGNDLLGEGRLASYLRDGNRPVSQYLKPAFFALVEDVLTRLERMVRRSAPRRLGVAPSASHMLPDFVFRKLARAYALVKVMSFEALPSAKQKVGAPVLIRGTERNA